MGNSSSLRCKYAGGLWPIISILLLEVIFRIQGFGPWKNFEQDIKEPSINEFHPKLGWKPKISFEDMINEMIETDLKIAEKEKIIQKHGFKIYKSLDE